MVVKKKKAAKTENQLWKMLFLCLATMILLSSSLCFEEVFFFFFSSIMTTDWNQIKRKKNTYTKFKTTSWQRRYAKKDIHMVETEAHTCSEGVCLTAFAWVETNNPHSHYTCFYVQEFFKRYMAEGKTFFFLFEFFFFPLPVLLKWTQTS